MKQLDEARYAPRFSEIGARCTVPEGKRRPSSFRRRVTSRVFPLMCVDVMPASGRRFTYGGVEVASIGGFLLVAGTDEALAPFRDVQNTVLVDDLDGVRALKARGGEILSGPNQVPNAYGKLRSACGSFSCASAGPGSGGAVSTRA